MQALFSQSKFTLVVNELVAFYMPEIGLSYL